MLAGGAAAAKSSAAPVIIIVVVVVLFLVAIGGIVAAIAIPNFVTAMQRAKQKRTQANLRTIAVAVEQFGVDKGYYPPGNRAADLVSAVSPAYVSVLPTKDGWEQDIRYECWAEDGATTCTHFAIGSGGKDMVFEHESLRDYRRGTTTTNYDCDIVWSDSEFVQYPEMRR